MREKVRKIGKCWNRLERRKKIGVSIGILLVVFLAVFIPMSLAVLEPVKSVVITSKELSYEGKEGGAYQITKSGKWVKKGIAEITFDVDTVLKTKKEYSDILFVFDISASMSGDKLDRVKGDAIELANHILENDKNKVGLITFDTASSIVSELTSNKEEITGMINNLGTGNTTNYYQAFVNVDKILKNYTAEENRDCIVLFLTDGYPNVDTPNEEAQYKYLKSQYPFLTINGIQYEMGEAVLTPIKKVSDYQYIADRENLHNVLFDAAVVPEVYENFGITDFIDTDYFTVEDESDIKVSEGKVIFDKEAQTVNWKMDSLKSGQKAKMTIKAKLKDELLNQGGVYPTNEKEVIQSKIGEQAEEQTSTKTPILADNYKVTYIGNEPDGCTIEGVVPDEESRSVFDVVGLSDEHPKCEGYEFKGWTITNKNIERVNDDYFVMPEEDIVIKGVWGRVKVEKSMEGEVYVAQTFYKMMKALAVPDDEKSTYVSASTGIDFGSAPSNTNGKGIYLRAPTKNDEYPVLYYRGEVDNNNVKFGGFCWKIVRTTSTGGVKLIYNGEPDMDGACTNTTGESTQIGTSKFNQYDDSPADVGYMYGNRVDYAKQAQAIPSWYGHIGRSSYSHTILERSYMYTGRTYYYGDSIEWDGSQYILKNSDGSEVVQTEWGSGTYASLKGKYRCSSGTSTSCTSVYYIAETSWNYIYYKSLNNNQTLADVNKVWNYGSEVVYENGVYTIQNPTKVQEIDWYAKYNSLKGNYIYSDKRGSSSNIWYIDSSSSTEMRYVLMGNGETYDSLYEEGLNKKWIYGNDVIWDGSKYTLIDTYESSPLNLANDYKTIATKYHYSCFSTENSCSEVGYIHYFSNILAIGYLKFKDGKKLEDAKSEMFANTNDSVVKQTIDNWYQAHMLEYTDKLEDTIWCNDRSIDRGPLKSKDEDSSITSSNRTDYTFFGAAGRNVRTYNPSVECENEGDRFTVSDKVGNGKLTYPVALLTADELTMAGHGRNDFSSSGYLYTKEYNWSLSPDDFDYNGAGSFFLKSGGTLGNDSPSNARGVRPVVSLAPGTIIKSGDGTMTDPYVVDMSENES